MASENTCPDCGSQQPADAPAGLCPRCLLRLGLGDDLSSVPERGDHSTWPAPRPVGGYLGQRRPLSGVNGPSPVSGILDILDRSIGPVPRVLLRGGSAYGLRPVMPRSASMPHPTGTA